MRQIPKKPNPYPSDYPLPVDQISGRAWWEINKLAIHTVENWRAFQSGKTMQQLIPVLRWLAYS